MQQRIITYLWWEAHSFAKISWPNKNAGHILQLFRGCMDPVDNFISADFASHDNDYEIRFLCIDHYAVEYKCIKR